MARGVRVAAVGEIVEDCYLDTGERMLGGISVNFARCAQAAGAEAALYGAVGDDARGRRLLAWLGRAAIARQRVRVMPGLSARQNIRTAADGERIFCGFEAGVLGGFRLEPDELAELAGYDAIALPCAPESRAVFAQACAAGLGPRIVADFSQDSPAGASADPVSWLEPHVAELQLAFVGGRSQDAEALQRLSAQQPTPIVLTAGADGAFAFLRGVLFRQPALPVRVRDTTGCGDAFQAGFTVRYLASGGDVRAALAAGAQMAALVASRRGAAPG